MGVEHKIMLMDERPVLVLEDVQLAQNGVPDASSMSEKEVTVFLGAPPFSVKEFSIPVRIERVVFTIVDRFRQIRNNLTGPMVDTQGDKELKGLLHLPR